MNKVILSIGGMSCSACSNSLEKYLNKQDGIKNATVNLVLGQALIIYDDKLTINNINKFIEEAGFKSLGIYKNEEIKTNKNEKIKIICYGILTLMTIYVSMSHMLNLPIISLLNINEYQINYSIILFIISIIYLIYGNDILRSGCKNLIHKSPNMDTLVSIGVLSSFIYSVYSMIKILSGHYTYVNNLYFESVVTIIYLVKLGRFIDTKNKEKTKEAIKELVQITPMSALLKKDDKEIEVTIDEVKKGDILIAKKGMKIAVDGVIIQGNTYLDESFITGESIPVKKIKGDKVIAGSINYDDYILYRAEKIGKDSTISEIVKLVLEAINTKAPISKLADKVSGYFVPFIIVMAILTLLFYILIGSNISESINSFVTVLVVACPCALGLATPLAIVISEGVCAKKGILVKSSEILENAGKVDTIVFDKTGTLTYGNLKVSKIYNYSNYSDKQLLKMVGNIESKSNHPISKAFLDYKENLEITNFKTLDGIGIKGTLNNNEIYVGNNKLFKKLKIKNEYEKDEISLSKNGNSILYVIENKTVIGLIGVKDIIRKNVKETIKKLHNLNKEVIMLTGDNEITSKIVAEDIGIKHVISNVMPKDKVKEINKLIKSSKKVMMVGDGINDAPALSTATIGVSINSGTDIAIDSADVILTNDNLENIVNLISISKHTIKNIKQNLFWAFFYNMCMIPIAMGILKPINIYINPMIAALTMMISSLTVVFNALRLKNVK